MLKTRKILLYLFLFLSPLVFCKYVYDYTIFKLILPQIFFLFIALTFLVEKKNFSYHQPLTILLSLYIFFNFFSFLINPFHHVSYPRMMQLLTFFSIFLLTVNLEKDKKFFFFLFASGVILSFWAISDFYKFHLVNAGFGNKNFFAGYIIFLIPLALSFALCRGRIYPTRGLDKSSPYKNTKKIIFLSLFLLFSFALILTKSQAAYLATIVSILFLFVLYSKNRRVVLIKIFSILFFVFLVSLVRVNFATTSRASSATTKSAMNRTATTTTNTKSAMNRTATITCGNWLVDKVTGNVRFIVWRGTINMIKVQPFLGWGPGTFALHYTNYRLPEYFLQQAVAPITAHCHNEYLEILSGSGIFGLLFFLSFIFLIFKEGLKNIHIPPPKPGGIKTPTGGEGERGEGGKAIIIGLLSGILAILVDNLLSTNLRQSFTPILLFFGMGLVVSYSKRKMRDPSPRAQGDTWKFSLRSSILIFSLLLFSLLLAAFNTIKKDVVAGFYLKKSVNARLKKDFPRAVVYYKKTISVDRFNLIAHYKLAFAYGVLKKYDLALSTYQKLYLFFPHYAQIDKNVAVLYYEGKKLGASLRYFRIAEKFNPYDIDTLCSIASIYLLKGEFQKAKFYLRRVLILDAKNSYALACLKKMREDGIISAPKK